MLSWLNSSYNSKVVKSDEFQFNRTSVNDTVADFSISDGDTLKFFKTGGAHFDCESIAANSESDELTIAR